MRVLIFVVIAAAALWGGYWFVGAWALERETEAWLDARRAEGWQAEAQVDLRGFPNRFDLTFTDPAFADPETGLAWSSPFFQLLALSYQPNHVIAVWPNEQTVSTPYEEIAVTTDEMKASTVLLPGEALTLDRANLVIDGMELSSDLGWQAQLASARLALRRPEPSEALVEGPEGNVYDIAFEADGLQPAEALVDRLNPTGALPPTVSQLRLEATVAFDRPWDRRALEERRPQPRALKLTELRANWGDLDLRAAGELTVDASGQPEGRISVKAQNWREILTLAVNSGTVPASLASTAENVLGMLARSTGDSRSLDLPLTFTGGQIKLGPLPIGTAPRLVIR